MANEKVKNIKEIYLDFKENLGNIVSRKKSLFKTYRTKIEEAKINELKNSLNNTLK